jgi:hypothetical protein
MKYDEMKLTELVEEFKKELDEYYKVFSLNRYYWFKSIDENTELNKLYVFSGYLMATREYSKNIGDLKLILEYIIEMKSKY